MFDFFKDMFSAFRQNSLERIKSPFLGAFVFSWVGFNWQMLAVLILSKDDILIRLNYINSNFDVDKLLLGPISTTILICIMLPTANKIITKLQKNTNHETNILILQSKIDIATKQLEIADFEAKKKLAEEREKKNIEADVNAIITSRDQLADNLKDARNAIDAHQKTIENLLSREASLKDNVKELESSLKLSTDSNEQFHFELEGRKKSIDEMNRELSQVRSQMNKVAEESVKNTLILNSVSDEKFKLQGEVKSLKEQNEKLKDEVKEITVELAKYKVNISSENKGDSYNNLTSSHGSPTLSAALAAAINAPGASWEPSATSAALAAAAKFSEQSAMSATWASAAKSPNALWGQSVSPAALATAAKYANAPWDSSAMSAALAAAAKPPSELWNQSNQIARLAQQFGSSTINPTPVGIIGKKAEKTSDINDVTTGKNEIKSSGDPTRPITIDGENNDKGDDFIEDANGEK